MPRHKIWQLYRADAQGRRDEELLDAVGWALVARVQDCLIATEALYRRVSCPVCGGIIQRRYGPRDRVPEEELACPEGHWSLTWDQFHRSIRNEHLQSAGLETFFREFVQRYPRAKLLIRTPSLTPAVPNRERLLSILGHSHCQTIRSSLE